jgi:predicted GNAT superfamily acetyltransferase
LEELIACEELQKRIWGMDDREVVPMRELITIHREGGVVLGAFEHAPGGKRRMVGFCYGFAGLRGGKLIHCSRMLGVLPEARGKELGKRLKLRQRQFALQQGIDLMIWTFDPLRTSNAHFNLNKLGVIAREYHVNLYGKSSSIFNPGLESDRFVAEWYLASRRVQKATRRKRPPLPSDWQQYPQVLKTRTESSMILARGVRLGLRAQRLLVEVPAELDRIRPFSERHRWRLLTRRCFRHYLRRSYVVTTFLSQTAEAGRRCFYLLERRSLEEVLQE